MSGYGRASGPRERQEVRPRDRGAAGAPPPSRPRSTEVVALLRSGATLLLLSLAPFAPPATPAQAQEAMPPPEALRAAHAALEACSRAASEERRDEAEAAADRAEELFRSLEERPGLEPEALTGRARVLTQCRIPLANFMRQGALLERSNELLEGALRLDPESWRARFALAMNHYHSPAFLGRTEPGIAQLEILLQRHAGSNGVPVLPDAYLYLGDLYLRAGRREAAAEAWRTGASRFPERRERYEERLEEAGLTPEPERDASGAAPPDPPREPAPLGPPESTPAIPPEASRRPAADPPASTDSVAAAGPLYELEAIAVEVGSFSMEDPRTATELSKLDVYTTPGGAADLLQVFQTMPGVTRVADGSDLYVRGGDPEETPMFVDGARLFYPGRFETLNGSIFGVLEPSTLRSAYFSSGGFSARYGNALSGVVDIETEGRPTEARWRAGLNMASVGGTGWLPLGDIAGVWGTAMATETSLLLALHGRDDEFSRTPSSFQGMAGIAVEPSRDVEIRTVAMTESDVTTTDVEALAWEGPFTSRGRTRLAAVTGRVLAAEGRASLRTTVSASSRRSGFEFGVLDRERTDRAVAFRFEGDLEPGRRTRVRVGLEGAAFRSLASGHEPVAEEIAPGAPARPVSVPEAATGHLGGWAEAEVRATSALALIAGMRADQLPGETGMTLDPRLALAYRLDDWTVRLGGGLFHQGRWRVRYDLPDSGSPSGVPTAARHLALGLQRRGAVSLRVEGYLKEYGRYVPHGEGPPARAGRARGVDALLEWNDGGAVVGWLSWSLLDAEVELAEVDSEIRDADPDGTARLRVPSPFDVTHTATAVAKWAVGEAWEVGATGRYASGKPYTPILGRAEATPERPTAPVYGELHGARLPDYARLDIRVTRFVPHGPGAFVVYLEALNVLDRANVMAYTYDETYRNRRPVESFFADRTLVAGVEAQF